MSAGQFLVGCAFLVLWVVPLAASARMIRRRTLPGWAGAPVWLVEALGTLALLLSTAQLLGCVGGLTRPGLTAAAMVVGLSSFHVTRRANVLPMRALPSRPEPMWSRWLGGLSVAAVLGAWAANTRSVLRVGNFDVDSLVYHWPYSAVFAQSGWTTRIHLVEPGGGASWHAANAELLGGITVLAFHSDWMLPLLNLGWLALALLAASVVGRQGGASGVAMSAASMVFAVPIMARSQAGSGFSDVASLALLLSALALLTIAVEAAIPSAYAWSGAAAGMALGTKETTIATVGLMGLTVAVLALRARDKRPLILWTAPVLVLGAFWYVRNLVREGNPIPTAHLGPFRSIGGPVIARYGFSVAHFLTNVHVIRHDFVPGLFLAWGYGWPGLVGCTVLAVAATVRRGTPSHYRALAAVGALSLAAYLVTPTTALGFKDRPLLFPENSRYALPAVLVLLMVLVRVAPPGRWRQVLGAVFFSILVVTIALPDTYAAVVPGRGLEALLGAFGCVIAGLAIPRFRQAVVVALALLVGLPALFLVGRSYELDRYPASHSQAFAVFAWAAHIRGARVGVDGLAEEYPLTGADVSNEVRYIGVRDRDRVFVEPPTCQAWRQAVNEAHDDYVVMGPELYVHLPLPAIRWVDRAAMTPEVTAGPYVVYRVTRQLDPRSC